MKTISRAAIAFVLFLFPARIIYGRDLSEYQNCPTNPSYRATEKAIARWEGSQYSFNLFRSSATNSYAMVMFDKPRDAQAGDSIAVSVQLEKQEAPQKEVAREKKETDDLEGERQNNIKMLRP